MTTTEYFTPSWRRPIRKNDTFHSPSSSSSSSPSSSSNNNNNNHNPNDNNNNNDHHLPLNKLWDEKSSLESKMWENKNKCTNPFDDDYGKEVHEYPIVGKFWHDEPRCEMDRVTTRYCVVLLQLVQLLGRGESWRIATGGVSNDNDKNNNDNDNNEENNSKNNNVKNNNNTIRRSPGNPHCREIAIDLAHTLLHLDRTDMRVRLYLPSLLMDGEYYQEAYDFLKHWLRPNASLFIMDLALMGGPMMTSGEEDDDEEDGTTTGDYYFDPTDVASGGDVTENPERWMDGEMVYPSIGMVFELAYLKCHLLCELRSGRFHSSSDAATTSFEESTEEEEEEENTKPKPKPKNPITLARACIDAGETELQRQVHLLLSLVHKWNPHLLPNLDGPYNITTGASTLASHSASSLRNEGFAVSSYANAAPPALSALLNRHPPGFELQYKMGNPGGGTKDEAVGIWQRDVMMWHDLDPRTMVFLAEFCGGLDGNLVDVGCLRGGEVVEGISKGGMGGGGGSGGTPYTEKEEDAENVAKRKEAEELVRKLQREKPDRTMGEIMMHPEMAQLMVKHLHTG